MFRWYEESTECYAFVADFEAAPGDVEMRLLKSARWWTRGWTLQELLAPESVRFFDSQWREFGDKVSLRHQIAAITGISEATLLGTVIGARQTLDRVSVAQRMSWAARRGTTRAEDTAYSLLGIFGVNMPLLYGEGGTAAFHRLQVEIMGSSPDQSLLAWGFDRAESGASPWGVSNALATSPADFSQCGTMLARGVARPGDVFAMTQRGLRLRPPVVMSLDDDNLIYCALNCAVTSACPQMAMSALLGFWRCHSYDRKRVRTGFDRTPTSTTGSWPECRSGWSAQSLQMHPEWSCICRECSGMEIRRTRDCRSALVSGRCQQTGTWRACFPRRSLSTTALWSGHGHLNQPLLSLSILPAPQQTGNCPTLSWSLSCSSL